MRKLLHDIRTAVSVGLCGVLFVHARRGARDAILRALRVTENRFDDRCRVDDVVCGFSNNNTHIRRTLVSHSAVFYLSVYDRFDFVALLHA